MKKILLAGILILLFFVGTAAAVSVNYAQGQVIPINTARENANSALVSYVAQGKLGSSAPLYTGASLSQAPIIIYDQSGLVYSYLFDVINKDGIRVGQVNAAANKILGAPVISIEKTPRSFDPDVVLPKVRDLALNAYPDSIINYVVFVMATDKTIAGMAILTEQNGMNHRMVYDIQTFKLRTEWFSNPGLIDASTKSSVFVSMSSSNAARAIQNYDSKTKSVTRVVPVMRRVIPVNYTKATNAVVPGTSWVKSAEKANYLSGDQTGQFISNQATPDTTTLSINTPKGKAPVSSSTIAQPLSFPRFLPV